LITVYTCATNGRDTLREDQCTEGARFIAYTDQTDNCGSIWDHQRATSLFCSPRRNARMHKILSHQFIQSHYSIWMDANVALKVPAELLIAEYLQGADLAVFTHRSRSCLYDEAKRCLTIGVDSSDVIEEQINYYRQEGFPEDAGLAESTVVIRRHTEQICAFNNAWWSELCRYSVRDQISFMFAVRKTGLILNFIRPSKYINPYFSITNRPAGLEPQRNMGNSPYPSNQI
jgi:hypothetical protein